MSSQWKRQHRVLVSINSTSEEVRRSSPDHLRSRPPKFPLIQLPRKSEADVQKKGDVWIILFPLIQLPRKSEAQHYRCEKSDFEVSINSTSEEVRRLPFSFLPTTPSGFPLIQLPRKSEVLNLICFLFLLALDAKFPLIQLPRKSEALGCTKHQKLQSFH